MPFFGLIFQYGEGVIMVAFLLANGGISGTPFLFLVPPPLCQPLFSCDTN